MKFDTKIRLPQDGSGSGLGMEYDWKFTLDMYDFHRAESQGATLQRAIPTDPAFKLSDVLEGLLEVVRAVEAAQAAEQAVLQRAPDTCPKCGQTAIRSCVEDLPTGDWSTARRRYTCPQHVWITTATGELIEVADRCTSGPVSIVIDPPSTLPPRRGRRTRRRSRQVCLPSN